MGSRTSEAADEIERLRRRVVADLVEARRISAGHPRRTRQLITRVRSSLVQAWVLAGLHRPARRQTSRGRTGV